MWWRKSRDILFLDVANVLIKHVVRPGVPMSTILYSSDSNGQKEALHYITLIEIVTIL